MLRPPPTKPTSHVKEIQARQLDSRTLQVSPGLPFRFYTHVRLPTPLPSHVQGLGSDILRFDAVHSKPSHTFSQNLPEMPSNIHILGACFRGGRRAENGRFDAGERRCFAPVFLLRGGSVGSANKPRQKRVEVMG